MLFAQGQGYENKTRTIYVSKIEELSKLDQCKINNNEGILELNIDTFIDKKYPYYVKKYGFGIEYVENAGDLVNELNRCKLENQKIKIRSTSSKVLSKSKDSLGNIKNRISEFYIEHTKVCNIFIVIIAVLIVYKLFLQKSVPKIFNQVNKSKGGLK